MLRITTSSDSGMTRFVVEGKLSGACVAELEKCWQSARAADLELSLLVDLTGVSFIDDSGRQLLAQMHQSGTRFLAAGIMTRCIVEEIESEGSTTCGGGWAAD
jgi:anti-anti-sigma regulatory factor